ncbi:cupin domain-containing protein [Vibrio sp. S4M6]|uniref:ribosomal protein uL16 3-hydroxylase n=1 Tax=Vibrio sinus TaxID=2946865 RepID=UPI002029D3A1|nr:cupin domain-containing protein [Vibrio sinus]MCL9782326.1 cupin domain-containing protein [Vibrio sinus]
MYQLSFPLPQFMREHWQRKPAVIKSGFVDFVDPISPEELAGLSLEEDVDSRFISNADDQWVAEHGPFEESKFANLAESHWQLVVQAANHWHSGVASLVPAFGQIPQWMFDDVMISYSSPHGGVGPHIDQYDVFIVQGSGKRHWRVGAKDEGQYKEVIQGQALRQIEQFDAIIDVVLEPGDILYIPPGFPHEGYALENSMSYSIGYRTPKEQELISQFADYYLEHGFGENHVGTQDIQMQSNIGEISTSTYQKLSDLIYQNIKEPKRMKAFLGTMLSQPRHQLDIAEPEFPYTPEQVEEEFTLGTTLVKTSGLKAFYHEDCSESIYINGEKFDIHHDKQLLDKLCNCESFALADLHIESERTIEVITQLVNKGYWYFQYNY